MDLKIIRKEHPNLFRLICEDIVCNYEAERWFIKFGKYLVLKIFKNDKEIKPYYEFSHEKYKVIDGAVIKVSSQWFQENLKNEALMEYFLLRQKGK